MQQTPIHDNHNPDLLRLIPADARFIVEVGCSSGALAREYKKLHHHPHRYVGIEIDAAYAARAAAHCDETHVRDIETADDAFWAQLADADCWVFGDTLEHTRDPWAVLARIRQTLPAHGQVLCCIPNAQHWSLQVRLSVGDLRYADSGLLDRTHLRWFTRQTLVEMFLGAGYDVVGLLPRVFEEPQRDAFIPLLKAVAARAGADPEQAAFDALPLQYVLVAKPRPERREP